MEGRGLVIVDALADQWGVSERGGVGKVVWATLSVPGTDYGVLTDGSCAT
ncbi:hypothetical protein ACWC0A_21330 [Streptomyces scopuliridis]